MSIGRVIAYAFALAAGAFVLTLASAAILGAAIPPVVFMALGLVIGIWML